MTQRYKRKNNMIVLLKLRHSVHLLISLYISVPHLSQSQARLCNHCSTNRPLQPIPSVRGWIMALLLLYTHMFSPKVEKSKCSSALSEMSYFYDLEKPGAFCVPNRILRDIGIQLFKTHKTGTVRENWHEWDAYPRKTCHYGWSPVRKLNLGSS